MKITKAEFKAAMKRAKAEKKLAKGVPSIKALKVDPDLDLNQPDSPYAMTDLKIGEIYLLMGEVGNTHHYIIASLTTGKTLPGMYHLDRFVAADEDEDL